MRDSLPRDLRSRRVGRRGACEAGGHGLGAGRILWIDDDPDGIAVLIQYVEQAGWQVDWVPDADSGLRLASAAGYDLVVIDLVLENGRGLDVLRRLRESQLHYPAIVLSGFGTPPNSCGSGRRPSESGKRSPSTNVSRAPCHVRWRDSWPIGGRRRRSTLPALNR